MTAVVYFTQGTRPTDARNSTSECDKCVPTLKSLQKGYAFDSEADARVAWLAGLGQSLMPTAFRKLWDLCFTNFKCTNNHCKAKQACSDQPIWLWAGAVTVSTPRGVQWAYAFELAREIKCVEKGKGEDLVPRLPNPGGDAPPDDKSFDGAVKDTPVVVASRRKPTRSAKSRTGSAKRR